LKIKFILKADGGKIFSYIKDIAMKVKSSNTMVDDCDMDLLVGWIKGEACTSFPNTKVFQLTTFKIVSKTEELMSLIDQESIDYDMAIKNISDTIGAQQNTYFTKTRIINGNNNDKFELTYMPDIAFTYDLYIKLRPCCEAGDIVKLKQYLYSSIYDSFRISFHNTTHFNSDKDNIAIKMDGACSIRALYVVYCINFEIEEYEYKDLDSSSNDQYTHFKRIMDDVAKIIKVNDEVHSKFMDLYNMVQEEFDKLNIITTTSNVITTTSSSSNIKSTNKKNLN
jgi:hypothetical protein